MKDYEDTDKKPLIFPWLFVGATLFYSLYHLHNQGKFSMHSNEYKTALSQVSRLIDINKNGNVELDEWKQAYSRLGLPFEKLNPKNPDLHDLEKIIKHYSDL